MANRKDAASILGEPATTEAITPEIGSGASRVRASNQGRQMLMRKMKGEVSSMNVLLVRDLLASGVLEHLAPRPAGSDVTLDHARERFTAVNDRHHEIW